MELDSGKGGSHVRIVRKTARRNQAETKWLSLSCVECKLMDEPITGQCVCGAVSYSISGEPKRVTICHCRWCQRRTGSAFGVEVVFEHEQISINDESVTRYRHLSDESGRWLDRHFCATCGSNIGFTLEAVPDIRTIAAGTFNDSSWLNWDKYPCRHVFTRSAQHWTQISDDVEQYEQHFR